MVKLALDLLSWSWVFILPHQRTADMNTWNSGVQSKLTIHTKINREASLVETWLAHGLSLARPTPLHIPVDTCVFLHGLQDCINPQYQPGTPPRLSQYSLAGEMELGREPVLSKNGDEDIGVCSCTTNIPCGCDHLVHWRRKGEVGGKLRREPWILLGLGEAWFLLTPPGIPSTEDSQNTCCNPRDSKPGSDPHQILPWNHSLPLDAACSF